VKPSVANGRRLPASPAPCRRGPSSSTADVVVTLVECRTTFSCSCSAASLQLVATMIVKWVGGTASCPHCHSMAVGGLAATARLSVTALTAAGRAATTHTTFTRGRGRCEWQNHSHSCNLATCKDCNPLNDESMNLFNLKKWQSHANAARNQDMFEAST
jgi:hypothetical protein